MANYEKTLMSEKVIAGDLEVIVHRHASGHISSVEFPVDGKPVVVDAEPLERIAALLREVRTGEPTWDHRGVCILHGYHQKPHEYRCAECEQPAAAVAPLAAEPGSTELTSTDDVEF